MKYRKMPSGNYRCQVMINGKKYSITARTVSECKEKESQIRSHSQEKASKINFKDAMDNLLDAKSEVLSANTMKGYGTIARSVDDMYDRNVYSITSFDLQKFINGYAKTHSPHSCANAYSFIMTVIKSVRPEVSFSVKLPQKKRREVKFPSEDEVRMMIDNADEQTRKGILIAAFTPARRGECCALKYKDIEKNTIHIHATITQNGCYEYKDTPKSSAGDRYVKFPKEIIKLLGNGEPDEYVVGLMPEALYMKFRRLCKRLNLPAYRFHDLRVFGCSWLHLKGYTNAEIMQRSGHETESCLVSVYRKNLASDDAVIKDISSFFAKKSEIKVKNFETYSFI